MKFLKYLQEEYYKTLPGTFDMDTEVFINPSSSDLAKMNKNNRDYCKLNNITPGPLIVRFLGDYDKQRLYVWNANLQTHDFVGKRVGLDIYHSRCFYGLASVKNNKIDYEKKSKYHGIKFIGGVTEEALKPFKKYFTYLNTANVAWIL